MTITPSTHLDALQARIGGHLPLEKVQLVLSRLLEEGFRFKDTTELDEDYFNALVEDCARCEA